MLKAEHLSFRYPKKPWLFQDFNLTIAAGEVIGLVSPSGTGKTTLGKLLAGYLTPTFGKITLEGKPLAKQAYCPVQLLFQNPELAMNPRWRIRQILSEGELPSSEWLDRLCIDQTWMDRWVHELSGGELQRIAVARSLNAKTRYLIADEMTAMLDANTQALIWQTAIAYAQHHQLGILVISHDLPLLKRLCHQIVTL